MNNQHILSDATVLPLIAALTPILISVVKRFAPSIPKKYLPALTPIVGVLLDGISGYSGLSQSSTLHAAVAGAAGSAVRELFDQLKKAGNIPTSLWSLVAVLFLGAGCSAISPGSDPVVVNAERTMSATFDLADTFLKWEYTNRAKVPQNLTKFADDVRVKFPPALSSARAVLASYKANKTPENKANLLTWLNVLREIEAGIRANYNPNL